MKKLMIVAAAAAMTSVALANTQVYEYKLTLKSTTCKDGKVSKNSYYDVMGFANAGETFSYRTSASLTLVGLSWGCDCERAIGAGGTKWWSDNLASDNKTVVWDGVTFWNPKTLAFLGGVYDGTEINTLVFNRMGKKGDEIEMTFTIDPSATATVDGWTLFCAGQGSIKDVGLANGTDCDGSYIKSAKGYVAGYLNADDLASGGCFYCGTTSCDVYDFCDCIGLMDASVTVAYGSWTMKFNSSAANKLYKSGKITSSYNFPKDLKAELFFAGE